MSFLDVHPPFRPEAMLQRTVVVGAGPVGALAALYAARRGDLVEVYELRGGESCAVRKSCYSPDACPSLPLERPSVRAFSIAERD